MIDAKGREILVGDQIVFAKRGDSHGHNPTLGFGTVRATFEHQVWVGPPNDTLTAVHRVLVVESKSGEPL